MKNLTARPSLFYAKSMLVVLVINFVLCFALIGLYGLILIGLWQVLDALFWVVQGDKRRRFYLGFVVVYLVFLYWLTTISNMGSWALFFFIVAPYGIAFWYWYLTRQHAREEILDGPEDGSDVDILDSDFNTPPPGDTLA